jgi:hydrogenase maturation protease
LHLLILGLGNVLLSDDGLGVAAVARLERGYRLPPRVRVADGGTLGLALLPLLEQCRDLILVDAVRAAGPPGTPVRIAGGEVAPAVRDRLSPHQVGVADLLFGVQWLGRAPRRCVLLGLGPASLELGLGRTPEVEARLPELVERVAAEARALGYPLRPRGRNETLMVRRHGDLARVLEL